MHDCICSPVFLMRAEQPSSKQERPDTGSNLDSKRFCLRLKGSAGGILPEKCMVGTCFSTIGPDTVGSGISIYWNLDCCFAGKF